MLVIFDTETCGVEAYSPIVELASIIRCHGQNLEYRSLAHPGMLIPPAASRVHGLYDRHVSGADPAHLVSRNWWDSVSGMYAELGDGDPLVLAGHNVSFDIGILAKYIGDIGKLPHTKTLCTLRLARRLLPHADSHRLSDVATLEGIELDDIKAHSALDDCKMVARLLQAWGQRTGKSYLDMAAEQVTPRLLETMPFGKHKGEPIDRLPYSYMTYMLGLGSLDPDVRHTFEHVLGKGA